MHENELPAYPEIERRALEHLDRARSELSEARDWLLSDWRPAGSPRPADAADTGKVMGLIGEVKGRIDEAKTMLDRR